MKKLIHIRTRKLISWYDKIVEAKNDDNAKQILLNIKPNVKDRYDYYEANFSSNDLITITDSNYLKNHPQLLSCYKSEGEALKKLKRKIRKLQDDKLKGVCQYCGIRKPISFDHYLPISDYPEFGVLPINLIPCCLECNGKKKSYWKENDVRSIINFYLDNIEDRQFLFAKINFRNNIPSLKFYLRNPGNNIDSELFQTIEYHFYRLELLNLYKSESSDELDEIIQKLKIYVKLTDNVKLKDMFTEDKVRLEIQFGINYWKAVMLNAMAKSNNFLDFMVNEINN